MTMRETEVKFRDKVRRIIQIGSEIAELSAESKKLRLEIGAIVKSRLGRTPTEDEPFTIALNDHGNSVTLVTITEPKDEKNKDFNVLAQTIKVIP